MLYNKYRMLYIKYGGDVMEMTEISSMLANFGFPIVMCGAMAWYVWYMSNKHREEISEINRRHKEEMDQVTQALNNNTLALQRLCDHLEG